jgi:hypothetical protein
VRISLISDKITIGGESHGYRSNSCFFHINHWLTNWFKRNKIINENCYENIKKTLFNKSYSLLHLFPHAIVNTEE